ncbi:hypothetical protein FRC08_018568 [Ceratobasidium sp. 394]|nr:hypothetical protein FRC08_018568 [Ceratobasidium sp. 394]
MLSCLFNWRDITFSVIFGSSSMFGAAALINDHDLERVSRCAPIPSIERLRRVLIKWHFVDSHLESMWNALEERGFTVHTIPTETATPAPDLASQPTSQPRVARNPPQRRNSTTSNPPTRASGSRSTVQVPSCAIPAPNASRGWWREYLPERNYEVCQKAMMEGSKRMFAKTAGGNVQAEGSKQTRPSTLLAPPHKRPRFNKNTQLHPAPAPRPSLPPSPRTPHFVSQPLAGSVDRMIVPSQRPVPPDLQQKPALLSRRLSVSAELQHLSPVRANSLALGRALRNHELATLALSLKRPRAPQPSPELFTADVHRSIYELRTYLRLSRDRGWAGHS